MGSRNAVVPDSVSGKRGVEGGGEAGYGTLTAILVMSRRRLDSGTYLRVKKLEQKLMADEFGFSESGSSGKIGAASAKSIY